MPQITVDRSWSVALERVAFATELHPLVAEIIDGSVAECKTRFRRIEECVVGDGDPSRAMVYLEIKIMAGRSPEVRTELTERVLELLKQHVGHAEGGELHLAVNVVELDPRFYRRAVA